MHLTRTPLNPRKLTTLPRLSISDSTRPALIACLSLTYKVLIITQPPYLHNLISVQRSRSIRSSSVVTLARPQTSSSLKVTVIAPFAMLHLVSGISSLYLFVNFILAPVVPLIPRSRA